MEVMASEVQRANPPPSETDHAVRLYDTVGEDRVAIDFREWLPGCARPTLPGAAIVGKKHGPRLPYPLQAAMSR